MNNKYFGTVKQLKHNRETTRKNPLKTPTLRASASLREISLGIASAIALLTPTPVAAQVGVTSLTATYESATPTNYSTQVGNPCSTGNYPTGCNSNIDLEFGVGATNDLRLSAFQLGGNIYSLILVADKLQFRRVDNAFSTGERQLIFFESNNNTQMRSSYTNTMEEALLGTIINKGVDNGFSNENSVATNNIERVDYIVSEGISIPVASAADIGFLILERGGNDPFNIAAITALDASGNPSAYGTLTNVPASTWGGTGFNINSAVMRREENESAFRPSHLVGSQEISSIYISIDDLTDFDGQVIYGYSVFPNDINSIINPDLVNLTNFPTDTSGASGEGGLDLMTGGAIFMLDTLSTISGNLYQDQNQDNTFNNGEPTLPPDVTLQLIDSSNNVVATANTNANGAYIFLGVGSGNYTIQVDTNDPNIPTGDALSTPNNLAVTVAGNPITDQNFGFNPALANNPNIVLVKRITAINSTQYTDLIDGVDDINSPNYVPTAFAPDDNNPNWPANYLQGLLNGGNIFSGDELEYTIYFLSVGDTTALNVLMCDRLPPNTTFIPDAFGQSPDTGILLSYDGNSTPFTGIQDGDNGQYFPVGIEPTGVYPNINCGGPNINGAVVVNLGNVPNSISQGDPTTSYGFVRFRVRVN
ncbi:SdrD B-like domain-containing protein [Nodularia harveyana UHCC-0300]|uniref:SdrD B-like domain-containing protein n=1 Tax=Nodularia harveyana UHCC-0300 TaxID=2974287 RepID=A0ABU5UA44_9CYAN|nr:SdrD B-like domain-containing protein [Nodularia harveyana]MEA5580399.1 SdrD B-like domain-containing protein [Nodularia harveyana UHCC-0300]